MCADYGINDDETAYEVFHVRLDGLRGEYFPKMKIPVIRSDGLAKLQWGLVPFWSKTPTTEYSTFNAKAESVAKSSAYREPFKKRRCLIPADCFYEWTREKPKTRYRFQMPDRK